MFSAYNRYVYLWLCVFGVINVINQYHVCALPSDNVTLATQPLQYDGSEKLQPSSEKSEKEDEKKLEEKEKEGDGETENQQTQESLTSKTANNPHNPNDIRTDARNNKTKRRRVTVRAQPITDNTSTSLSSQEPTSGTIMSETRRNSYRSIADRRKFFNRTRNSTKKPEHEKDFLEPQETTNRPYLTHKIVLMNEIRDVKTKLVTDSKNETNYQRGTLKGTLPNNTTAVINPRLEFGQKITLRKRNQELARRRKEKMKEDVKGENSTNKHKIQTQSTKLEKIDKKPWVSTPRTETDMDNLVMPVKTQRYSAQVKNESVVLSNVVTSISIANSPRTEAAPKEELPPEPLPLSFEDTAPTINVTRNVLDSGTTTESPQETTVNPEDELIRHVVYEQEILKLGNNFTTEEPSPSSTPPSSAVTSRTENATRPSIATKGQNALNATPTTPLKQPYRPTHPASGSRSRSSTRLEKVSTPVTTSHTTTENIDRGSTDRYPITIEINENNKRVLGEMFPTSTGLYNTARVDNIARTTISSIPTTITTPTTVPSTSKTTTPRSTSTIALSTSRATETSKPVTVSTTVVLSTSSTVSSTTHKSTSTSTSTEETDSSGSVLFTNVTELVRVEVHQAAPADILGSVDQETVGMALYVLAAFGLVPLLLALLFTTRFLLHRHRKKGDCDSDRGSDMSVNVNTEPRTRHSRLKSASPLKKSPSSATTTTLVGNPRLSRIAGLGVWEGFDKQESRIWEIQRSLLNRLEILGQGNFGQVWKAQMEDGEGKTRLVAVKTVKEGAKGKEHEELIKELHIMQRIGSHPNVVTLLGCCTDQEPYYLVMEYVQYGKLLTYLREHRTSDNYYNFSNDSEALTSRDLTVFAYCVARGMEYLASKGIIHRDLAARNVLVDHNKLCKIADFGMSRILSHADDGQVYEERQHKGALPIRWMAPESLFYSVFTHKSDVWSFGILLWEIVTLGSTPYPCMGAREVMRKVQEGYRLERPNHCKPELYRLMSQAWLHEPADRPDFPELRRELSSLLDDPERDGSYVDLDRFAVDNRYQGPTSSTHSKGHELKRMQRSGMEPWTDLLFIKKNKRSTNNGKGTVTLTGQGSFTVNSRIMEATFNMV